MRTLRFPNPAALAPIPVLLGLPITLADIADMNRTCSGTFTDPGCVLYHADQDNPGAGGSGCPVETRYKAPTLFGRASATPDLQTVYNPDSNRVVDTLETLVDKDDAMARLPPSDTPGTAQRTSPRRSGCR